MFAEEADHEVVPWDADLELGVGHDDRYEATRSARCVVEASVLERNRPKLAQPRRPAQVAPSEQVQVQVGHGVAGIVADVQHQAVTAVGDSRGSGIGVRGTKERGEQFAVAVAKRCRIGEVTDGNEERVRRSLRRNIANADDDPVIVKEVCFDLPGNDPTEQTLRIALRVRSVAHEAAECTVTG